MIIIRASSLPGANDCMRRALAIAPIDVDPADEDPEPAAVEASEWPAILADSGVRLRPLEVSIGAAVGTAVHAGAALLIQEQPEQLQTAIDCAVEVLHGETRGRKVGWDTLTPTILFAERQVASILRVHRVQVAPRIIPVVRSIETPLVARLEKRGEPGVLSNFALAGRHDVLVRQDGAFGVRELKTGRRRSPAGAQLGAHALLVKANYGERPGFLAVDFIQRCQAEKPQVEAVEVPYEVQDCQNYALATIHRVAHAIEEYRKTGNPDAIPANPASPYCSLTYCPARGTNFCKVWQR